MPTGRPQERNNDPNKTSGYLKSIHRTLAAISCGAFSVLLQRSVAFIAWTMEEQGLLGSQYFAQHPIWPLNHIVAASIWMPTCRKAARMTWSWYKGNEFRAVRDRSMQQKGG